VARRNREDGNLWSRLERSHKVIRVTITFHHATAPYNGEPMTAAERLRNEHWEPGRLPCKTSITWASRMPAGEGDDDMWLLYSKGAGRKRISPLLGTKR
jgi:hypothetical protein